MRSREPLSTARGATRWRHLDAASPASLRLLLRSRGDRTGRGRRGFHVEVAAVQQAAAQAAVMPCPPVTRLLQQPQVVALLPAGRPLADSEDSGPVAGQGR